MQKEISVADEAGFDVVAAIDHYASAMTGVRQAFGLPGASGRSAVAERSHAVDRLVRALWRAHLFEGGDAVTLLAVGGYGREQLFPHSDVDLLFVTADAVAEKLWKDPIRRMTQRLWDAGLRVAATTRTLAELERFQDDNAEFSMSLLDRRVLAGEEPLRGRSALLGQRLVERERKNLLAHLLGLTQKRHARYGNTIFHLEPNIKECPGGLRDADVCGWISRLNPEPTAEPLPEFGRAVSFLDSVRCFLHLRQSRDVNALDWKAQDAAAAAAIGVEGGAIREPAYWMQLYFRHARAVARRLEQQIDALPVAKPVVRVPAFLRKRGPSGEGFHEENGRIILELSEKADAAQSLESVLRAYEAVAATGLRMVKSSEDRVEEALPALSAQTEDGGSLWQHLQRILLAPHAGLALRSMHAGGLLELLLPEFHGIDALVIRDAYHRYTVDEHTFVLIDTLHGLQDKQGKALEEWPAKLAALFRDLQHPELLYLAALLHDTGKGRASDEHTEASARLASGVLRRLELDAVQSGLVLHLIEHHLEMSANLRRDIYDAETIRAFAAVVPTPEELRMLALFTFADISAVHPDAMTPWKAENLWRLYIGTANYLDRNVDDERVDARISSDLVERIVSPMRGEAREVLRFLEGFPQRYLQTRSPEQIRLHYAMSRHLSEEMVQLDLSWGVDRSEITLVTPDRRLLFAKVAGVLATWGMNILTADAFSNSQGIVVDSFRFTDTFRTLELNPGERERLRTMVRQAVSDEAAAANIIGARRRGRRRDPLIDVETSVKTDTRSSSHSTLVQVVAQDSPGLLYALSQTLGEERCNIEVALIDTEGDTAIDVFYLTRGGTALDEADLPALEEKLMRAIRENAV